MPLTIHHQRSRGIVEQVIAGAPALGRAHGFPGRVEDFSAHDEETIAKDNLRIADRQLHWYSQSGQRLTTGPVLRPTA